MSELNQEEKIRLKKQDTVYYARINPRAGTYDVCELKIRTVQDDWYVGLDKRDKHAYLFYDSDINKTIFIKRNDALSKVKTAEKNKTNISEEIYYEEY